MSDLPKENQTNELNAPATQASPTPSVAPVVPESTAPVAQETKTEELPADTGAEKVSIKLNEKEDLERLKRKADVMGVQYHPNIGIDKLRERIKEHMNVDIEPESMKITGTRIPDDQQKSEAQPELSPEELLSRYMASSKKLTAAQERNKSIKDAAKLVRIQITCMNPAKREWQGEVFTVSNSVVGTFKKYVPFNNPEGWHVPYIILQAIRERQCQIFVNGVDSKGRKAKVARLIPEFAVVEMSPLTEQEIKSLATRQAMANGTAN